MPEMFRVYSAKLLVSINAGARALLFE